MNFFSLLFFACILNGLLLVVFLFSKKYSVNKSNYFLGFFILIITGNLTEQFLAITGYLSSVPHFMAAFVPSFFALGPLYFFYVKTILNNEYQLRALDGIHLLPAIIVFFFILPYYQLPGDYKYEQFISFDVNARTEIDFKIWFHLAFFVQSIIYSSGIIRSLNSQSVKEDRRSDRKVVSALKWLRRFTYLFLFFIICYILTFSYITFQKHYIFEVLRIFTLLTSTFIYLIVYWSFKKSELFNSIETIVPTDKAEYSRLKQNIECYFEKDQLHLDPDLDLYKISKLLNINTQYLSRFINQTYDCSFTQLVNKYRIEEAKKLILDPAKNHLNMLGIAMEAGFMAKNTFTRAFQKHTGMTPSMYKKRAN